MRKQNHSTDKTSHLALLLFAPVLAVSAFVIALIVADRAGRTPAYEQALWISAICYPIGLATMLFIERDLHWIQLREEQRPLEILLGLAGLGISVAFVLHFAHARAPADLRGGLFSAVASGAVLVPRRTDKIRAIAFAFMAVVTVHRPLVSSRPPFISLAILLGAAATICLIQLEGLHTVIRRLFSVGTFACMFLTVVGIYGLYTAYQMRSMPELVIFSATVLFFGIGTIVIIVWGPWSERHPNN